MLRTLSIVGLIRPKTKRHGILMSRLFSDFLLQITLQKFNDFITTIDMQQSDRNAFNMVPRERSSTAS